MSTAVETNQRLRSYLNGDQPSRERLCMAILALNRTYSNIRPRRPEGGRDGGRDIECQRDGQKCFGAVAFKNNASDSKSEKSAIRRKFTADVEAARAADPQIKAFVFFCNVDLSPGLVTSFESIAHQVGFTHVEIYHRERLRMALDDVEGLALRFQYLKIPMSDTEQAAFFARFGRDLQEIMLGRFDRIEQKLDELEFRRWKSGKIRRIELDLQFHKYEESLVENPEHFRFAIEFQGSVRRKTIILGGRDRYHRDQKKQTAHFGRAVFFHRDGDRDVTDSWVKSGVSVYGGVVTGIHATVNWTPVSHIHIADFFNLSPHLHLTENLLSRVKRFRLILDDYVFFDRAIEPEIFERWQPWTKWPGDLNAEELKIEWRGIHLWDLDFDRVPPRV